MYLGTNIIPGVFLADGLQLKQKSLLNHHLNTCLIETSFELFDDLDTFLQNIFDPELVQGER